MFWFSDIAPLDVEAKIMIYANPWIHVNEGVRGSTSESAIVICS